MLRHTPIIPFLSSMCPCLVCWHAWFYPWLLVVQDISCKFDVVMVVAQLNYHVNRVVDHVDTSAAVAVAGVAADAAGPAVDHDIGVLYRVQNCRMRTMI